jgi:NAD(P)-dependent dehydrogenase (short-subunit alcohol dehydrogenase family)
VSVFEDTRRLVDFALQTHGQLDIAFNNAGITPALVDLHEVEPADRLAVISINLTGVFYCMKSELPHFVENGGGAIVNMASTAGLMAHAGRAAYSASKHGIVGLTRSSAVEYAQRNIRINAVAPGPIGAESFSAATPEVQATIRAKTAMNRVGTAEEVASVVNFLLSDESSFVTGSVYEVNGGQTQL